MPRVLFIIVVSLLCSACSTLTSLIAGARGGRGLGSAAAAHDPEYEPGLTELVVTRQGLAIGMTLSHARDGEAHFRLLRGTQELSRGALAYELDRFNGTPDKGYVARLGGGLSVRNHRAAPAGSVDIAATLSEGAYVLEVTVDWRDLKGGHHRTVFAEPFQLATAASTVGGSLTLAPQTRTAFSALRLESSSLPYQLETESGTGTNGERPPAPGVWLSLTTPLGQSTTHVEVQVSHEGTAMGTAALDLPIRARLEDDLLEVPTLVWAWPSTLSREQLLSSPGAWTIDVAQDGAAVTQCHFRVEGGHIVGAQARAARLECGGPRPETTALAKRSASKAARPDPEVRREAIALSRSEQVRTLKRELLRLRQGSWVQSGMVGQAVDDERRALTDSQARAARQRQQSSAEARSFLDRDANNLERKYRALVAANSQ